MAGLALAVLLYAALSLAVRRPYQTPLDFRAATAPSYQLLQVAVAVMVLASLDARPDVAPSTFALGCAVGAAFVAAPHVVGIARRECLHQFEIRNLHPLRAIVPRDVLLFGVTIPAIALCEETVLRLALPLPWQAVPLVQWLLCRASGRATPGASALACLLLAGLHGVSGNLGLVVGAHAAIQALTGRLTSPGIFGDVFPLLQQVRLRNLSPARLTLAAELAAGVAVVAFTR